MGLCLTRREALVGVGAFAATGARAVASRGDAFSWAQLQRTALTLARQPHVPQVASAGASAVSYDALNGINYRADATIWPESATPLRLFPLTQAAASPVAVSLVENGRARPLPFTRSLFQGADRLPENAAGFSGFRVMDRDGRSDWLAFQGASYFRSAGALDQYGLSARALAIDTGLSQPEEFPYFRRFWIERGPGDGLTIYGLLDSPSVAGAWRFVSRREPGGVTQDVSCVLQLRRDVARLGLAPLTSMFWYGEGSRAQAADWRPEIHDSDGLALLTGQGERVWRPLVNPARSSTSSFSDRQPRGFGLLQRDRAFDHYQDDGVFYEKRPNLWVEPAGDWCAGSVMLVELPTRSEIQDNVVAFWSPAAQAKAGSRYAFDYRLRWTADEPQPAAAAHATDCWRGTAGKPGAEPIADAARLVADFVGPALTGLDRTSGVEPILSLSKGKPISVSAYPVVGASNRWRLIVDVPHRSGETIDLRAYLRRGTAALTETLVYQFT